MSLESLDYLLRYVAIPLLVSVVLSSILTYVVRGLTHRFGLLDKPGEHKQHAAPTPTLGGLPVFLAFLAGCMLAGFSPRLGCILQASAALIVVGVCDDIWGVRAKLKLGTLFLATAWLWWNGIHLDAFGLTGLGALLVTFLWVGLISSAFNGVDNADGAAGGLAIISAVATFAISWATWQRDLATVSLVLGGACFGFLLFNFPWPRATIFLGDSGSLFLGFGLAAFTILGEWSSVGWKSGFIGLLLVFVPLFDFLFILVSRGLDGRYKSWEDPIRMCGRDHLSHRLRYVGLSPRQVLAVLYGAGALSGLAGYAIAVRPELLTVQMVQFCLGAMAIAGLACKQIPLPRDAFVQERTDG